MNKIFLEGRNYEGTVFFNDKETPDCLKISLEKENQDDFYKSFYKNNYLEKLRKYQASIIIKNLKKTIVSSKSILEIGCGKGTFIDSLLKIYKGHLLGVDPFLDHETPNKKKCGLFELSDELFDSIFLLDVFEHFEDNNSALKKIISLLSEEGHLILKVPNKDALYYKISKFISFFNKDPLKRLYQIDFPPQHFFYYNKQSILNLCKNDLEYLDHFYISEVPIKGLYSRLWQFSIFVKIIAIPCIVLYNLLSFRFLKDSLVISFKKRVNNK